MYEVEWVNGGERGAAKCCQGPYMVLLFTAAAALTSNISGSGPLEHTLSRDAGGWGQVGLGAG